MARTRSAQPRSTADGGSNRYVGRQRAYRGLDADIDDIIAATDKRILALIRQSLQDVINEAQLPVAKGGKMRVDTGFLRASGQASLSGLPTGPARGEKDSKPGSYAPDGNNVTVTLGDLKIGSVFYFGWTASYAKYRELYDGFLEGALQNWARIVAFNTDTIKQRIKK